MNTMQTPWHVLRMSLLLLSAILSAPLRAQDSQEVLQERLDSIEKAVERAEEKGRMQEIYALADRYCNLCDTSQATFAYGKMLGYQAAKAFAEGRLREAVSIGARTVEVRRRIPNGALRHVATALSDLALYHYQLGNHEAAVSCCQEALDIFEAHGYKNDPMEATTQSKMAAFLSSRGKPGDYEQAVHYGEASLKHIPKDSGEYIDAMGNLAMAYALVGDYAQSDKITDKALKVGRRRYTKFPIKYAVMLTNHSAQQASRKAYTVALRYADYADSLFRQADSIHYPGYARLLLNRAVVLSSTERYAESVRQLEQARALLGEIAGKNHADYLRCLSELAVTYRKKGDIEQSERCSQELDSIIDRTGTNDERGPHMIVRQAELAAGIGDFRRAIRLEQTACKRFEQMRDTLHQAVSMGNLSRYHIALSENDVAVESARQALDLIAAMPEQETTRADLFSTLSRAYHHAQLPDSALRYATRAVEIYRQQGDTLTSVYTKSLSNLALYTFMRGDTVRALALAEEAKTRQVDILGEDHPENATLFYNLARYYCDIDSAKVCHYYHRAMALQRGVVRSNFSHLTASERENYWNTKSYLFKAAPVLAFMYPNNDSILVDAYNAQLFTKGLLLNSEINFRSFLQQTGDSILLSLYERLEMLNQEIQHAYSLPPAQRAAQVKAASTEAARLEKRLVNGCKQFGDFMAALDRDLHDVSDALGADEMAIELMNLQVEGWGDTYLALYLRHGWTAPRCKVLFSDFDLKRLGYDDQSLSQALSTRTGINKVFGDAEFGSMVWGKLLPELEDVNTVFFSPTGMFYLLGAENLCIDEQHTFASKYACYRLSSTRLLTTRTADAPAYKSAILFGGLTYDMTFDEICAVHENLKHHPFFDDASAWLEEEAVAYVAEPADFSVSSLRDGFAYLPYTRGEVLDIGMFLMLKNIDAKIFKKSLGTEEAFKRILGREQSIVHIATHGFDLNSQHIQQGGSFSFRISDLQADDPLSLCGLLFSGANYVLRGGKQAEGIESGILTAREISRLNMSGTQLVVLSACRTGVGEMRDDGVFGLQRGFKKAGANTLLMSLWKVDDHATKIMMTSFYEALMQGHSKRDAYLRAQAAVKERGFNEPSYWASFVMLDGM